MSFNATSISELIDSPIPRLIKILEDLDPIFHGICRSSGSLSRVRERMFSYLDTREADIFSGNLENFSKSEPSINAKLNAKECVRVLRNIFRSENEDQTGFSALNGLRQLTRFRNADNDEKLLPGQNFLLEILYLVKGINLDTSEFLPAIDSMATESSRSGEMSGMLDVYAEEMERSFDSFLSGLSTELIENRKRSQQAIMRYFGTGKEEWQDYKWHLRNVFTDGKKIAKLVTLSDAEAEGLEEAERAAIPVQITPYYLSLFNMDGGAPWDHAVRAQVLPSVHYCRQVVAQKAAGIDMDFMGEHTTSPITGITRRYPEIVILKPFDSCPQICVYCQRNWEITDIHQAALDSRAIENAVQWIDENIHITEVLVTGGDPLTLSNGVLARILGSLAKIDHVTRIRLGTRTPVTLPQRFDSGLLSLLDKYHVPGRREIAVMTHVEHASELTPDLLEAVSAVRRLGIGVYNQQVFTYYNSKRFETSFLRRSLRLCGIDPYYTFNMKGKEETDEYRVPIARLLQERKEEARLLPGLDRTDEPVFNVPRLGKSHLRSWQHHEPVMILPDGKRVYRFLPWESRLTHTTDYLFTDLSIAEYLKRLQDDGEDIRKYQSIWYYF